MKNIDDFDPQKEIGDLSATLNQPDKFAAIFCTAAKSQKVIDELLHTLIKGLLQSDNEIKIYFKNIIREYEKEEWKLMIKGWFGIAGAIALVAIGSLLDHFLLK